MTCRACGRVMALRAAGLCGRCYRRATGGAPQRAAFSDEDVLLIASSSLTVRELADQLGRNPEVVRQVRQRIARGWSEPVVYTTCRLCDGLLCTAARKPRAVHPDCWRTTARMYRGDRLERERRLLQAGTPRRSYRRGGTPPAAPVPSPAPPPFRCTNCGAGGKHAAHGLCWPCYQRQRRAAQREPPAAPRPAERSEG